MASLPDFVFDTCRTYQHDHALFITWLGEQAAKCNLFPAAKTGINPKKMQNGKARSGIKYTLSLKEYIPFAKAIIESTPLVKIPSTIFRGLQRTIAKRRECAAWYSHFAPDKGHLHMIKVLEETRDILRTKIEVPEMEVPVYVQVIMIQDIHQRTSSTCSMTLKKSTMTLLISRRAT